MKTKIFTFSVDALFFLIIAGGMILMFSLCSCSSVRQSQDWKPNPVKMKPVSYNGRQQTQGYVGY